MDYGEGERADEKEAKKRLRQLQSRVHDGVVILDEEFKNLQTFRNRAMLRDACIVLTNSTFEENEFEIRLSSDPFDPPAALLTGHAAGIPKCSDRIR